MYQILYKVLPKASNACLISKLLHNKNVCLYKYSLRSLNVSLNILSSSPGVEDAAPVQTVFTEGMVGTNDAVDGCFHS